MTKNCERATPRVADFIVEGPRRPATDRSVTAFDLTFSAPKSVSVLYALGNPDVVAAVEAQTRPSVTNASTTRRHLFQRAPKPARPTQHCAPTPQPSPTAAQDVRRWTQAQRCVLFGLTTSLVGVEILASARRHGISDDDIRHAVENSLTGGRSDEETGFAMLVGLDQSGNLIEIGIVVTDDIEYAIQAMRARNRYSDWL